MSDTRINFFINITGTYLGTTFLEDEWEKTIKGWEYLQDFLDNLNYIVLYSFIEEVESCKQLVFTIESPRINEAFVIFSKTKAMTVDFKNITNGIQIITIPNSPAIALYNSLNHIFPTLLDNDYNSLKKHLATLQGELRCLLLNSDIKNNDLLNNSDENLSIVCTLEQEAEYWNNAIKLSKGSLNKTNYSSIRDILEPLVNDFRLIDTLQISEVENILEVAHNVLDDLWRNRPPYPSKRMKRIMDIIGRNLTSYSTKMLKKTDIWMERYNLIFELLQQHKELGDKWITSCNQLTTIFWPNYNEHIWNQEPYEPEDLMFFVERLKEILEIRTLHKQLIGLLSSEEKEELDTAGMFSSFQKIDVFLCGVHTQVSWINAKKEFESLLQPAEKRVAYKLQKQLSGINANTRQLLYEFTRYSQLINRPLLKQTLQPERQYLLTSLYDYVKHLQTQTSSEIMYSGNLHENSIIVRELMAISQLESRLREVHTTSEKLLSDLNEYSNLNNIVMELLQDLKKQHVELFDSWTSEMSARISDNTLSLRETDPVVQFSSDKLMKVNYTPRLVLLINEVRQLKALGYPVPNNIDETAQHAKKFMRHARILEQIANFHNTIGDRMITSQRPMMLKKALQLSKLVQDQEVVSWNDTKSVEKYVDTLKQAVEELSKQNNILTSYHQEILQKIETLNDVDLIKDYSKWKETVKQIRNILLRVEEKGFHNMQNWIADVADKLAAVLEKQYVKSLDKLHLYLPEIYADLVYTNTNLQFSPSEEDLRKKYEQQLIKFLDIPKNFYSYFEFGPNIFSNIIDRSKLQIEKTKIYENDLFQQLQDVIKYWKNWLQIGELDVQKLRDHQHWDLHFKVSKNFGQEIAKLPSTEEKVGCFVIGLSRLRSDLQSHNRSYWDLLVLSLKNSIAQDLVTLQNFIDPATALLTKQSVTLEEIEESSSRYGNILQQMPEMNNIYIQIIEKSKTLSSWTREQIDSVQRMKGAWERLQSLLENYQHIISTQMKTIQTTLNVEGENINKEIERFLAKWEEIKPKQASLQLTECTLEQMLDNLKVMKEEKERWEKLIETKEKLIGDYQKYNLESVTFPLYEEVQTSIEDELKSWELFEQFYNGLVVFFDEVWIVMRKKLYSFEEFIQEWQKKLNEIERSDLVIRIVQECNKYEDCFSFLKYVRGDDFSEKHWMNVFDILGINPKPVDQLILKDFLDVSGKIKDNSLELQAICKKAASEIVVRQALSELDQWDIQARFVLSEHKDSHDNTIMIVKNYKELLNNIGDHQSLLHSVKNSADYESFSERVTLWETKLLDLECYLSSLLNVQKKWLYLEPIFENGTLNYEKNRFSKANKDINSMFKYIAKDPRISAICRYPDIKTLLQTLQDQLSRCQQNLDKFLSEKREKFPRFFFLGDDDLLEIIGQSSKEQVIQTHLKKIFAGINSIQLDEQSNHIKAICSLQGETVPLSNVVDIRKPVEEWLHVLVKEMQTTLKDLLIQCLKDGQAADPLQYPSQILCLAGKITFTLKCEQAIGSMTVPPLLAQYKANLAHYTSLFSDIDDYITKDNDEESNVLEIKLKALILDCIHHISILEEVLEANITKVNDWAWHKQMRFYSNSLGEITIKMAGARMEYSYEYLGNSLMLVQTPLTEKCFLSLTQGMHLGMGGNPYGPAGTGKTESVKALGSLLGRQVLVFNCDEGIDCNAMTRILSGLIRIGAWGCFDEFNRLEEATLSALSIHIHAIQSALKSNAETLMLMNQEIKVNKHCGIFVTLNPAGGGYGGRNNLPANLKQLFRPIVMTHPDHEDISKSLLLCEGFANASVIAKKIVEVFSQADKLLSKQNHYDWGLRAIRTILIGCGRLRKSFLKIQNKIFDYESEMSVVVEAIKSDILSKLIDSDRQKFNNILNQTFIQCKDQNINDSKLMEALTKCSKEMGFSYNEKQIKKCAELYEQINKRMGVAIVGPSGSGKSTIRNLLFKALISLGKNVKQEIVNPKSMPKSQLLGSIEADTRQWNDGVLTLFSFQAAGEPSDVYTWIVCDGDIDPEWIESLNSVLDDNRLLTLPSGWRIKFGPNVNFLFETHDLNKASPATISRLGIVLLSDKDVNPLDYINYCLTSSEANYGENVRSLTQEFLVKCVNWIQKQGEMEIQVCEASIINAVIQQLKDVQTKEHFGIILVNVLGQIMQTDFRELFAHQVFEWIHEPQPSLILLSYFNKDKNMLDNYLTNVSAEDNLFNESVFLIKTGIVLKALDVLKTWIDSKSGHFLLVGAHGSAKSLIIQQIVSERSNTDLLTIYCSAVIQPSFVISKLAQYCISVKTVEGKTFRPKNGHLVIYLKNLHLLKPDKWGTNMLIEFLIQLITYKAFFDSHLDLITLENFTIVGSLKPTDQLTPRFTSKMCIYNIEAPEQEDANIILTFYLQNLIDGSCEKNGALPKAKISKIVGIILSCYNKICVTFTPVRFKHYTFSFHDLVKWCYSITYYPLHEVSNELEIFISKILLIEAKYLFKNKLVTDEDKIKLDEILTHIFQRTYEKIGFDNDVYHVPLTSSSKDSNKCIMSKLSKKEWLSIVENGIVKYEREDGQMLNIILNDDLLELTSSVCKGLNMFNGHLVLIGQSGVGRKCSIKIASALYSAKLIIPASDKQSQLNNDLKYILQKTGIDGEEIFLLLEDHLLSNSKILSAVNTLMSSGEIPTLFSMAELNSLIAGLSDESNRINYEGSLLQLFSERVKEHLHVIVCIDSKNPNIWQILANYPSFTSSTIIWKDYFSAKNVELLPNLLITNRNSKENEVQVNSSEYFQQIYEMDDKKIPQKYISLINLYIAIYTEKILDIQEKQRELEAGVSKLNDAKKLVAELRQKATIQQQKLEEKQSKANTALDMISNTMKNANKHKEEMESLKQKTEEQNVQLIKRKAEIEKELAEVEPLIEEARSAVSKIKTESLTEIRSLRAPPETIRDILEGVLRLMGIQDTSWTSMKSFLSKRGVKEDIKCFDVNRITTENRQAVERLMSIKRDSFDPVSAKRASVAAVPLVAWVTANVKYSHVLEKIKPLEKEQYKLKQNLNSSESQLGELNADLLGVDQTVANLKEQLSSYTKEAAEIEIDLNSVQATLSSAEGLVEKLNDEYSRWKEQVKDLTKEKLELPVNCLLAAAFVVYMTKNYENTRRNFIDQCVKSLNVDKFNFEDFLCSKREKILWQHEGLPYDELSLQNAVAIKKTLITPLLVDPTSKALQWLKVNMKDKNLECTNQSVSNFNTVLELAIRFGKTLIIEEIEDIPFVLYGVLRKSFITKGERKLVSLNGKTIDYHPEFRLVLATRNEHIKLSADIEAYVTILNFSVTPTGFIEQLMSAAIQQENPDLERRKKELLQNTEKLQEQQYNLQKQLLRNLANSSGNILQDKNLIESLNNTKASSLNIAASLEEQSQIERKLMTEYETYKEIAVFGSSLFFAVNEFTKFNVLYTISASAYIRLFLKAVDAFQTMPDKMDMQKEHLLNTVFSYCGKGIFKKDRMTFGLHLVRKVYSNKIPEPEWNMFLENSSTSSKIENEGLPSWIPKKSNLSVANIQNLLPNFYQNLQLDDQRIWNEFMTVPSCETRFPKHCHLSDFEKLLVVQALRPDKLLSTVSLFLNNLKEPPVLDLQSIYKESIPCEPILIITTPGSDPSNEIRDLIRKLNIKNFLEIAMGEGQEKIALEYLSKCSTEGQWLVMKNLHLMTNWLATLCQNLKPEVHQDFRLWLITEPQANFNYVLAQSSLKIVYEAPHGLNNNLQRTYLTWGEKYINKLSSNSAKLFFIMGCVHSILQERRTFIPQGWSKWYEFNESDFTFFIKLLEDIWQNNAAQVPWDSIKGLCSSIVYGGKIENIEDMNILKSFLKEYCIDDVLSHRWKPFGLEKVLPISPKFEEYYKLIMQLPSKDPPIFYGLPENIERTWQELQTSRIIKDLKSLNFKNSSTSFNREIWQKNLTPFLSIWKKLNQGHDYVRSSIPDIIGETPMEYFLSEEFSNGIRLVQIIHKIFASLNKICKGLAEPENIDLEIGNSLLSYQTPKAWLDYWDGPKEAVKYLRVLYYKLDVLSSWNGKKIKDLMKHPIQLSFLFRPEAFLASFKIEYSRSNNLPLDDLVLYSSWKHSAINDDVLILSDLLLEGALFDGHKLKITATDSENINTAPNCYLNWKSKETILHDNNLIEIPLYTTTERKKKLAYLQVPCDENEKAKWVQAGVAFFLEI